METLLDLLDASVRRFSERPALRLHDETAGDPGAELTWTYRELDRRSRIVAWRLRALGLAPGDRILTWSPSTPALPAAYFGALRAGVIFVPLDLRMAPDAIHRICDLAGARRLILGTGRDAPDPRVAGLENMPTTLLDDLVTEPGPDFPPDWATQVAAWARPAPSDLVTLIFTSGTTGAPKGVMLAHDNLLAALESYSRVLPHMEHRVVSMLPLSHLFELLVGLLYVLSVGADVRYVRSRNPRVIFEALRRQRVTSMIAVPQILDLFWSAIEQEVDKAGRRTSFERLRRIARHLPFPARRWLFRSIHARLGGGLRLFVASGAFLPPAIQQAWEDLGVIVMQGYGATETTSGTVTTLRDHGLGTVGWPAPSVELRLAEDGEVLFRGPTLFKGYWANPEATAAAFDPDGWYRTGDVGRLDAKGRLVLMGRKNDRIALPNGLNVYPEDVENALRIAGIRDAVLVETRPGRLQAVVLRHDRDGGPVSEAERAAIAAMVKAANISLGQHQRPDGWRLWPESDFPRTHTLKVRRGAVRDWAVAADTEERPAGAAQGR